MNTVFITNNGKSAKELVSAYARPNIDAAIMSKESLITPKSSILSMRLNIKSEAGFAAH